MARKFIKNIEDFICGQCGSQVQGNGYTNHCPQCLWSKHVDTNPGDRLAECQGMMKPLSLEIVKHNYIITHRYVVCGHTKRNKTTPNDSSDALIALSARHP